MSNYTLQQLTKAIGYAFEAENEIWGSLLDVEEREDDIVSDIIRALPSLPDDDQRMLSLKFHQGYSTAEVASMYNYTPESAEKKLNKIKHALLAVVNS